MRKPSAAQRRHAAIGPAFRKEYLEDGMTYGAWLAIFAARQLAAVSEHRRSLAGYKRKHERAKIMQSARICAKQARALRIDARYRCPLP